MVAVTQLIPNYIGGVSSQADEKKQPGQVISIDNGYTDPTYGLTKRNGFQFLKKVATYTYNSDELEGAHWFFINRGFNQVYFGAITTNQNIKVWNAVDPNFTEIPVTIEENAAPYLTAGSGKNDYDTLTIRAQTFVVNKNKIVEEVDSDEYPLGRHATIKLKNVIDYVNYTVYITVDGAREIPITFNSGGYPDIGADPPDPPLTANDILTYLQTELNKISGLIATKFDTSIELVHSSKSFQIDVEGGGTGGGLECYQDEVGNSSRLAVTSIDGRRVKVVNTADDRASYFVKFIANDPEAAEYSEGGQGYWQEDIGWDTVDGVTKLTPEGLVNSTMPHALVLDKKDNPTDPDSFTFKQIDYTKRLVGNNTTNERPSFVGEKINFLFLYSNRLGFLSTENVILSVAAEFENFYFASAQTIIDSDPIDLNCSSIRPARLFAAIPQTQGLILFSDTEQFNMYSDGDVLRPQDAIIRSISNYEVTRDIKPVDIGTSIVFLSKTPAYTRTMGMTTRGQDNSPIVVDIGKVAEDYVPNTVTDLISSSQNSFVSMSSVATNDIYFYKFFNNGREDLMQAWFKWKMFGHVQSSVVTSDMFFVVQRFNGEYNILGASLAQSPNAGMAALSTVNPRIDMYYSPLHYKDDNPITYDPLTDFSTIPKPYAHSYEYDPIVIQVAPMAMPPAPEGLLDLPITYEVNEGGGADVGFLPEVTVADNGDWLIKGDWVGEENILVVGTRFNFSVELPTTYYRNQAISDYTAVLTISRYKFSFGDTGLVEFKSKAFGSDEWNKVEPVPDADYYNADSAPFTSETIITVPIYQKNKYFKFKIESDSPTPVSLNSMMWEGQYSPRYYRRTG